MQKNKVKSRCQAEADEQKQEQGQGPLTQHHKETSILFPAFSFPLFSGFFFLPFCWH
jgi:hypothetical protein